MKQTKMEIRDVFWSGQIEKMCESIIPYQYEVLSDAVPGIRKSHAIENFRIAAKLADGEYAGMLFQDSDVAKWIEGAAYSLRIKENPKLESEIDELIEIIGRAQQSDGYLNTCLLYTSGYNIAEAAELVGYHDCSYFSRVFKKYCGVSPKQFILEGDKAPISMDGG